MTEMVATWSVVPQSSDLHDKFLLQLRECGRTSMPRSISTWVTLHQLRDCRTAGALVVNPLNIHFSVTEGALVLVT